MHHPRLVAVAEAAVESDHAADERGRENPDTAIVEEIDAARLACFLERRVVAEMRIAVDDAEARERQPPRLEHRARETIADFERSVFVCEEFLALKPVEREQSTGRELGPDFRHAYFRRIGEHLAIERDVLRFAAIIELLADARGDFLADFAGVDRRIHAAADREDDVEL